MEDTQGYSLVDIAIVLWQRRWLFLCLLCLSLAIAVVLYLTTPPLYRKNIMIHVGRVHKERLVEPNAFVKRVSFLFSSDRRAGGTAFIDAENRTRDVASYPEEGLFEIPVMCIKPADCDLLLEKVSKLVMEEHELLWNKLHEEVQDQVSILSRLILVAEEQVKHYTEELKLQHVRGSGAETSLILTSQSTLINLIPVLREKEGALKMGLIAPFTTKTMLLGNQAGIQARKVKPKILYYVVGGIFSGVVLAITIVFLIELLAIIRAKTS